MLLSLKTNKGGNEMARNIYISEVEISSPIEVLTAAPQVIYRTHLSLNDILLRIRVFKHPYPNDIFYTVAVWADGIKGVKFNLVRKGFIEFLNLLPFTTDEIDFSYGGIWLNTPFYSNDNGDIGDINEGNFFIYEEPIRYPASPNAYKKHPHPQPLAMRVILSGRQVFNETLDMHIYKPEQLRICIVELRCNRAIDAVTIYQYTQAPIMETFVQPSSAGIQFLPSLEDFENAI